MQPDYSIVELCAALAVSRSGYHAWAGRQPGPRAQADERLLPLITQPHRASRQICGSPRITRWLAERGHRCGRVRVARLMRQAGLAHRWRRRFRPLSLTDSEHDFPVAPNLLAQRPPTLEGWLYVAALLDRCVGWCIIPIGASNTPAPPIANGGSKPASFPA